MNWIDISVGVSPDLPVWPGDPPLELERIASLTDGDEANVSRLAAGVHVGTHVDAPLHFVDGGASIDQLDLDVLMGPARVVEMLEVDVIDATVLERTALPAGSQRLLFRTRNSRLWDDPAAGFQRDFVAVDESGARWLVERGVRLVGVDYLSVAPWGRAAPTHNVLLGAGVVIVEGLDLRSVEPGEYILYCLPVKLMGSDGAPARALLTETDEREA